MLNNKQQSINLLFEPQLNKTHDLRFTNTLRLAGIAVEGPLSLAKLNNLSRV